jgi:hypothetical protein
VGLENPRVLTPEEFEARKAELRRQADALLEGHRPIWSKGEA